MKYNPDRYWRQEKKLGLQSWFKWCLGLIGLGFLIWIVFELCMLAVDYPSIFN